MRCKRTAVYGTQRCYGHGGGAPLRKGTYPGSKLVTAKGSKFHLNRLAANYLEIVNDPELLSLRDPLALITIRIQELINKIDAEEAIIRQDRVQNAWEDYKYYRNTDNIKQTDAFAKLDREMSKAYDEYRAWEQMFRAIEVRRKLTESEVKRLKEMNQFITQEEAYKFLAKVQAAIIEVLNDHPRLLKKIQFRFIKITGDGDDDVLESRGRQEVTLEPGDVDPREILDTGTEFQDGGERGHSSGIISGSVLTGGAE